MGNPTRTSRKAEACPLCVNAQIATEPAAHRALSDISGRYIASPGRANAQILRASGYSFVEPDARRGLSNIADRYIASIGRAASLAEARGRTEPNVIDIVLSLEDHAQADSSVHQTPRATRPALYSGALVELAGFVVVVREVPFVKPLSRREAGCGKRWESFAVAESVAGVAEAWGRWPTVHGEEDKEGGGGRGCLGRAVA